MSNEITVWGNTGANPSAVRLTNPSGSVMYPPGVFPGTGGDDGTGGGPGGIGGGDGGINSPIDPTVFKPEITYPNYFDNVDVDPDADATSSAFASSNAQTHAKSRWMIFQQNVEMDDFITITAGTVLYDSGATASNLTTLPLESTGLQPNGSYLIRVRYKGSGGGWGPWSDLMPFTMAECADLPVIPIGVYSEMFIAVPLPVGSTGSIDDKEVQYYPNDAAEGSVEGSLLIAEELKIFAILYGRVRRTEEGGAIVLLDEFPEEYLEDENFLDVVDVTWDGQVEFTPTLSDTAGFYNDGEGNNGVIIRIGMPDEDPSAFTGGTLTIRGGTWSPDGVWDTLAAGDAPLELRITITPNADDDGLQDIAWEYFVNED